MKYKNTNSFQSNISVVGLGTWSMGGKNKFGLTYGNVDEDKAIDAILKAVKNGVNLIDTAPVYGAEGASEKIVGKALKQLNRDEIFLVTKFGNQNEPTTGARLIDNSYENIIKECDESLERLQTSYIDFYLMHYPDPNVPLEETMGALQRLKSEGKVKYIGLSNPSQSLIEEAEQFAEIDAIQLPYSMVNREQEELLKWCSKRGYITMTYGSLGAGVLSGNFRVIPTFDEKDIRNRFYPYFKEPMFSKIQSLLHDMDIIADKYEVPVTHVALRWITQKDYVTTSLVGVLNVEEVEENCMACSLNLTNEELMFLDKSIIKYQL